MRAEWRASNSAAAGSARSTAIGWGDKMRVERLAQPPAVPALCEIDMRDLADGVDARVGAPGAMRGDGDAAKRDESRLQRLLHGKPIGLSLPAHEWRAVIFKRQFVARHEPEMRESEADRSAERAEERRGRPNVKRARLRRIVQPSKYDKSY